ncbi:MAG: DUF4430 domain-containing protein [Bacillota bacterium]|nr:DUF4430 domain-containing protein [Bacillota bacterium]
MTASGRHTTIFIYAIILSLLLLTGCSTGPEAMSSSGESEVQVAENTGEAINAEEGIDIPASTAEVLGTGSAHELPETRPATASGETGQGDSPAASSEPVDPPPSIGKEPTQTDGDHAASPASVANTPEVPVEDPAEKLTVMMTIRGLQGSPAILPAHPVPWEPGDTVLDLLIRVTREQRIHMAFRGRGRTGYVEGIDNLYEFDHGPASGWVYSVNGVFPDRSAGGWEADQGDEIVWWFTLDAGRDVEAVSP